jgi:hypothetical protein
MRVATKAAHIRQRNSPALRAAANRRTLALAALGVLCAE